MESIRTFERLVTERATTHCPVAYLTGRKDFAGLPLAVTRGVFIPRPETEELVEHVVEWWRRSDHPLRPLQNNSPPGRAEVLVDACCGSGAIAIALARALGVRVIATDSSETAVAYARHNAVQHGVNHLVSVLRGSGLEPLARLTPRPVIRAVVANPPYVPTESLAELAPDIVNFEPREALDGGGDGLALFRILVSQVESWLEPGGLLAFEIGSEQGSAVLSILGRGRWEDPQVKRDVAGLPRVVLAVFRGPLADPEAG